MSLLPKELMECVPHVQAMSVRENAAISVKDAISKIFQRPKYSVRGDVISAQIASSALEIRVDGPDRYRTYLNSHAGSSIAEISSGKPCNTVELFCELIEFEGIPRGK